MSEEYVIVVSLTKPHILDSFHSVCSRKIKVKSAWSYVLSQKRVQRFNLLRAAIYSVCFVSNTFRCSEAGRMYQTRIYILFFRINSAKTLKEKRKTTTKSVSILIQLHLINLDNLIKVQTGLFNVLFLTCLIYSLHCSCSISLPSSVFCHSTLRTPGGCANGTMRPFRYERSLCLVLAAQLPIIHTVSGWSSNISLHVVHQQFLTLLSAISFLSFTFH